MILLDTGMRKMPDKCSVCKFFREESPMYCTAVVGYTTVSKPYERRPEWCPLHEVTDTDTISRQDAINLIERYCDNGCEIAEDKWCPDCQQSKFAEMIKALPPSPSRPKGKWIPQNLNKSDGMISTAVYYYPKCSVCGSNANYTNFCPNCGAEMTEGEE